jgi:hypothetical protein
MASPAELVFKTRDLCAAILGLLPGVRDVASAVCVNTAFKRAAAVHWKTLCARTLPLSRMHDAVGAAATLRVLDAAARAAGGSRGLQWQRA